MTQTDLQTMIFHLDDMHRPNLNIEEDMELQRGLSVKIIMKNCSLGKLITFSYVLTFEIIYYRYLKVL
jgi:hypothetical protein